MYISVVWNTTSISWYLIAIPPKIDKCFQDLKERYLLQISKFSHVSTFLELTHWLKSAPKALRPRSWRHSNLMLNSLAAPPKVKRQRTRGHCQLFNSKIGVLKPTIYGDSCFFFDGLSQNAVNCCGFLGFWKPCGLICLCFFSSITPQKANKHITISGLRKPSVFNFEGCYVCFTCLICHLGPSRLSGPKAILAFKNGFRINDIWYMMICDAD